MHGHQGHHGHKHSENPAMPGGNWTESADMHHTRIDGHHIHAKLKDAHGHWQDATADLEHAFGATFENHNG